jgi:hypothetical protein
MADTPLRLSEVPVPTLGAFMEAAAAHSTGDLAQLANFAGFSPSTARKAVPTLESFGILRRSNAGPYVVTAEGVSRGISDQAKEQIIRRALLGYRAFELLIEGIALGETKRDAIRKTLLLLGLPDTDAPKLEMLLRWGSDLCIIEFVEGEPRLVAELTIERADELGALSPEDVESEAKARLFNARRLGRDANNYLDDVDRGLLADALLKHESDARKSVDASGQALEDFLRHVADEEGLATEAKKQSGAAQLANLLHTKNVIHNHHQKMVDAAATIRNATAHRKDKKTLAPWEVTPFGAFSTLSMTLTAIRSIHQYVKNRRQTI